MIVRLLLAVVVTGSLLGTSMPAISAASVERTDAAIERQVREIATRLAAFVAANDATETGSARMVATLRVPARTLTSAGVTKVAFERRAGAGIVAWHVGPDHRASRLLVDRPLQPVGGELTLDSAGTHRLLFRLKLQDEHSVVTVQRLHGRPSHAEGRDD